MFAATQYRSSQTIHVTLLLQALQCFVQINMNKRLQINVHRQFLAALGEGTLFTDLEVEWAETFGATKHQSEIIKQTGQMKGVDFLTVAPETVILSIG